ncbi:MAG: DUF1080 domain-containing protein [Saprospiraceae bacterium]
MKYITIVLSLLFITLLTNCKEKNMPSPEWISIFNGKNLDNWTVKINGHPTSENFKNTFRVENGILKVSYSDYEGKFDFGGDKGRAFGHLFYNKPLSKYKLRLKYRFVGEQVEEIGSWAIKNSGIMLHSQSPQSMGVNQEFPVSLEAQLLGGYDLKKSRPTGNICTPGMHVNMKGKLVTQHCIDSNSETIYDESWVDFEVLVLSDSLIVQYVNGKEVSRCTKPIYGGEYTPDTPEWKAKEGKPVIDGYFSLQSESHPIEFKNIELMEL